MRIHTRTTIDSETGRVLRDEFYLYEGSLELADRSAQNQAGQATNQAFSTAGNYGAKAGQIGGSVVPTLERDINNAPGYNPTDLNAMLVGGEQGAGGAASGITGQAGLEAARTRNSGATSSVLDQAMRRKGQILSQNALNVQGENANLKQRQRSQALSGLEGMYGTDVGAQLKSMGIIPSDISADVNAGKSGWLQDTEGLLGTLSSGALAGNKIATGG
jgi:hypothetical protein